jgi:hypothetical protein
VAERRRADLERVVWLEVATDMGALPGTHPQSNLSGFGSNGEEVGRILVDRGWWSRGVSSRRCE